MKRLSYLYLATLLILLAAMICNTTNANAQYNTTNVDLGYYGEMDYYTGNDSEYIQVMRDYTYNYGKPDVYLQNPKVYTSKAYAGQYIKLSCQQYYKGVGNQYYHPKVAYYLSNDNQYDAADVYLGNSTSNLTTTSNYDNEYLYVQIPYNQSSGTKYILYVADYTNDIYESNENNNLAYTQLEVYGYDYEYVYNPYNYGYKPVTETTYSNISTENSTQAYYHSYPQPTYTKMETYPNPVTLGDTFYLSYFLKDNYTEEVKLTVYDMTGKVIDTAYTGGQAIGVHYYEYDTSKLAVGTYYYTLTTGDYFLKNKLIVNE